MVSELTTTSCAGARRSILLIGAAALATFPFGDPATAQLPDELYLTGMVRDFASTHPDFAVTPAAGFGHYAANVNTTLGADGRPVFSALGYKVSVEWTDNLGRPIAPHLYGVDASGGGDPLPNVLTEGRLRSRNTSAIDSYDSSAGPYGPGNMDLDAIVATNSTAPDMIVVDNSSWIGGDVLIGPGGDPNVVVDESQGAGGITGDIEWLDETIDMPTITIPADMPAYSPTDLDFPMNSNMSLSGDHHIDLFNVRRNAVLTIVGDVRVVCEDRFLVGKDATVVVPDGSSLTVWCKTQLQLYGPGSVVNPDTANPDKVQVYIMGADFWNDQLVIAGAASGSPSFFCGRVIAPVNRLDLDQSAEFFGTFWGLEVEINNSSKMHVDLRPYGVSPACVTVNDVAGSQGAADSGGITSAATFDEWYRDVLGVNQSQPHVITLTRDINGVYEYLNSGFFPIDDQLLGNEGDAHNRFFTYALSGEFTYEQCTGQFVTFQGGDGMWLYVGDQLVIDQGGVMPVGEQIVELDRLGLVDGQVYSFGLFYADRNDFSAVFRLRTNIELTTDNVLPSVLAVFD